MALTALIVEDSEFMQNLLTNILEEGNIEIVGTASNGVEGVDLHAELAPDLVLMDIVMPVKDGIEATDKIKTESPETIVLMCTSVGQEEKMKEAVKAGADGYIKKPFQQDSVLAAIKDQFGDKTV